jgi:omega-hydroxy-beta-dihydromenaquinone-9 sulfotransferase
MAYERRHAPPAPPPLFIVGHMRSGTTHLHNLLAASGQFTTIPPVLAGMPCEARSLARLVRPLIEPDLPDDRLIDDVAVAPDSPTEDEIALANLLPLSCYHAIYFRGAFARTISAACCSRAARRRRSIAGVAAFAATSRRWRGSIAAGLCSSRIRRTPRASA